MTFKGFTFQCYICICFYISIFILHLVGFGSYWMCSFLQHSSFCWYNSHTPPFSLELACISSCLSFCPSLCEYFHTPPQICLSHLIISFHSLSPTLILTSWSLRASYFAFVYTFLMLETKFTSSHGLLGPSLFLIATCVCKTKEIDTSFFSFDEVPLVHTKSQEAMQQKIEMSAQNICCRHYGNTESWGWTSA